MDNNGEQVGLVAVITGASRGLGAGMAETFARRIVWARLEGLAVPATRLAR
jgi:NAD(P)-dependent dehydrogenase (short-subunit alcohol dehydrogenase family)